MSATLLADGPRASLAPEVLGAVALHEGFHVFQRARHPGWVGNEGDLLLYPFDDAGLLALRRRESNALQRALEAREAPQRACLARLALDARAARFGQMDSSFVAYERLSELNEGLATWVQLRALGRRTVAWPAEAFGATALRPRFYVSGPSLAFLLDAQRPGWQAALEADDTQSLDGMLEVAVGRRDTAACTPGPAALAAIDRQAATDAAAVVAARATRRASRASSARWSASDSRRRSASSPASSNG